MYNDARNARYSNKHGVEEEAVVQARGQDLEAAALTEERFGRKPDMSH